MLLQDPRQVDGAHKRVLLQTNALTRPEPGRRSTQKSTITNKILYKTNFSLCTLWVLVHISPSVMHRPESTFLQKHVLHLINAHYIIEASIPAYAKL